MHGLNIFIHVTAGILAMLVGVVSYASAKGQRAHTIAGRVFLSLMAGVIITATLGVLFFRDRPFLTLITIQSFYMAASGYRALWYKTRGPGWPDLMLALFLLCAGCVFIYSLQGANIVWHGSVVFYLLLVLFIVGVYDVLRISKVVKLPHAWLPEHFLKMTSAYTALLSAGLGTLMSGLGPISQILPAALGNLLLIGVIWRFRHTFRRKQPSSTT
ncbi:MAG: hypothetical protein AAF564_01070 [Bacteroidota bacterium]